jgi:putative effector of murein hydrolase
MVENSDTARPMMATVAIAAIAIVGLAVSLFSTIQLLRNRWTNYLQDHLCYGVLPAICYGALFVASWMILMEKDAALDVLAAALLFLLAVNIRNAWDLTLSMVHHQTEREQAKRRRPRRSK